MKSRAFDPQRFDVQLFCQQAAELEGELDLCELPRLDTACVSHHDAMPLPIFRWKAAGQLRKKTYEPTGKPTAMWMRLQVTGEVLVLCQRCLQPVKTEIQVNRDFEFVADEDIAAEMDELVEHDVLALNRAFNLVNLIEDEALLALPLVPMHEQCPAPLPYVAEAIQPAEVDDDSVEPANPFAQLAKLKKHKPS